MHDVHELRGYYVRRLGALERDFGGSESLDEFAPFLEILRTLSGFLESGSLTSFHPVILAVGKRCSLVHSETKRRRKTLWDALVELQKDIVTKDQDPELKELKDALALVNRVLCCLPERLTLASNGRRVTVVAFFQEQLRLAIEAVPTLAEAA